MPWNRELMDLREEFVFRAKQKKETISKLCREYEISRPTAYKWLARYEKEGIIGIIDRSKRPLCSPKKTEEELTKLILDARKKYPAWGARKLKQILKNEGYENLPSESTFNRVLQRNGDILVQENRKKPFIRFERSSPNELWQMDFKGYFLVAEGKCHPLTVLDDCSRYSICLKACSREDYTSVREGLEQAFRNYGLPEAMTMDNGAPWCGRPGQRLSQLTIWLMRMGIKVGHSRPYHPQTQGKDERFHRSLKEELLRFHNFRDFVEVQRKFDEWRKLYNYIRPHEALNMLCPGQRYIASPRLYSEQLPPIEYKSDDQVRKVSHAGEINFKGKGYYIGEHLKGENVALRERNGAKWDIYYVNSWLGSLELKV